MKCSFFSILFLVFLVFNFNAQAQKRRVQPQIKKPVAAFQTNRANSNAAVVVDERLAVLRSEPSLYARPIQRMRRGHQVSISGSKEADGVTFYRINFAPNNSGWMQAEAVVGRFRRGDDARLAKLVQSSDGFERIERAQIFLDTFPDSPFRPAILLLTGDLMEETALKISGEATRRLDRREMAASGAPLHSFYLNYVALDRYRRLDMDFVFNPNAKLLHYDGAAWREIVQKFPKSAEAVEAQKRLDLLKEKMETIQK
ncbi:MAG: SH3 domain-containing protein [Pyrinomonadaceae bacterium]